jgi:hypothetical protein
MATGAQPFHISPNRLEGSLCDIPLEKLLESCRDHLVTGTIKIKGHFGDGTLELRAGIPDTASYAGLTGDEAMTKLRSLPDGLYTLTQRLPDLTGDLGDAAECQGDLSQVPLVRIMNHCEKQALSCTITVISEFERGEIVYRAGEITDVILNGTRDEDAIVDITRFQTGRFRVAAPPLAMDIGGWPSVTREPTEPFKIEHLSKAPPASASPARSAPAPQLAPALLPGVHARESARGKPRDKARETAVPIHVPKASSSPPPATRSAGHRRMARGTRPPTPSLPMAAQPVALPAAAPRSDTRLAATIVAVMFLTLLCAGAIAWVLLTSDL